jgi:hypothetical protein
LPAAVLPLQSFLIFIYVPSFPPGIMQQDNSEQVIINPRLIARHYIGTWFFLDLISSIPLDYIFLIFNSIRGSEVSWKGRKEGTCPFKIWLSTSWPITSSSTFAAFFGIVSERLRQPRCSRLETKETKSSQKKRAKFDAISKFLQFSQLPCPMAQLLRIAPKFGYTQGILGVHLVMFSDTFIVSCTFPHYSTQCLTRSGFEPTYRIS